MKIDLIHNKIFYLILLGVMFLIPKEVFAQTIHMSTPNEMWGYYPSTNYFANYTPNYYDGFYLGNAQLCFSDGSCISQVGAKWNNVSLCDGKSTSVSGQMAFYGGVNTLNNAIVSANAGNLGGVCQTSKVSNYIVSFTCVFDSVVNSTFQVVLSNFNMDNADAYSKFNYGVSPNMNVTCNIGTADVINNQNQNSQNIINNQNQNSQNIIDNQNQNSQNEINNANQNQQQTNERLDDIKDMDISDSDKELPDDSSYNDYNSTEQELLDKTKDADLNALDVGLDVKSSSWVWDTLTSLIQSNSVVFGMIIAILSIGVIKLVLGR